VADTSVQFAPYRNNILALDQVKTFRDNNAKATIHEIEIREFEAGTFYQVELVSTDEEGNVAQ
jgi:hypothetical protein